jgi:hypothetical protein
MKFYCKIKPLVRTKGPAKEKPLAKAIVRTDYFLKNLVFKKNHCLFGAYFKNFVF